MNKLSIAIFLLAVVGIGLWLGRKDKPAFQTLSPQDFSTLLADSPQVQLVDVRTPDEYTEAHLRGARLFNVQDPLFESKTTTMLQRNHAVAVYCRSGKRSAQAADVLAKAGFRVYNLDGGIVAWTKENLPTESQADL